MASARRLVQKCARARTVGLCALPTHTHRQASSAAPPVFFRRSMECWTESVFLHCVVDRVNTFLNIAEQLPSPVLGTVCLPHHDLTTPHHPTFYLARAVGAPHATVAIHNCWHVWTKIHHPHHPHRPLFHLHMPLPVTYPFDPDKRAGVHLASYGVSSSVSTIWCAGFAGCSSGTAPDNPSDSSPANEVLFFVCVCVCVIVARCCIAAHLSPLPVMVVAFL